MAANKVTCPDCGAILKSSTPMPPGKKVKCPKCGTGFEVPEEEEVPKPAARAARKTAAAPAPAPEPKEEPETYAVIKEPEDERAEDDDEDDEDEDEDDEEGGRKKKPDLTFALDISVKDPRGPAQEAVVRPSNWLVLLGGICAFLYVLDVLWGVFPFLFAEHFLTQDQIKAAIGMPVKADDNTPPPPEKDWSADQRQKVADAEWAERLYHIFAIVGGIFFIFLSGFAIYGAVKMQTMESWGLGLAGTIVMPLAAVPVFLTTAGIIMYAFATEDVFVMIISLLGGGFFLALSLAILAWTLLSLRTLLDPKVREGFEYEAEEAKKRF